jgi:phenylalanyl-tRNA synthetase beta chain
MDLLARRMRAECVAAGLLEARPMPFVREGIEPHRVMNPLAEDEAYLRTRLLDTLARRVEFNFAHMQRNVRLFEIGTAFTALRDAKTHAPIERVHAAAVISGDRRPAHFTEPRPPHFDQWDAKALAISLARTAWPGSAVTAEPSVADALWIIAVDGVAVGGVESLVVDAPVWAAPAFGIEIDLDAVAPVSRAKVEYAAIPTMPAMEIDLALLVPDSITSDETEKSIRASAGDLLESLVVFDEFRGAGIPEGTRSLGWRLTFRHPERTLREREIQGRTAKILGTLEAALGIRQRTA